VAERAQVLAVLEDFRRYGLAAPLVSMRQIRGKLWELRISRPRIFYVVMVGDTMVLLHAYKKQWQKAPTREIETANRRMAEVLEGRRA
jgi:phage-related protein